ncbi:LysR substrate-binding domain-containing protein [Phenylobacterium sp.]|jgi:LysR family glycine cleavage system transcriptional activator|uniref:LysR substrate-binding domain-containing protein n=1 Tax=Phenylobacterium sp. TaxID=1871053 RepID=UPI003784E6ED
MTRTAPGGPAEDDRLEMPPFAALRAFEAVGRCGGIRRAAAHLDLDHTVVSRHLRTVEAWVGVTLYDRDLGLTEAGRIYCERISRAIHDIAGATSAAMAGKRLAHLKISCVPGFGFQWLAGRLIEFRTQHPDLELEFHPTDRAPDLLRHEASIDIRFAQDVAALGLPSSIQAVEFAKSVAVAVASPAYLAKVTAPERIEDLLRLNLIHEEDAGQWRRFLQAHGVSGPEELPGPKVWHAHATLEAARCGEGVALTNRFLLRDDLEQGRLMLVGPPSDPGFARQIGGYWFIASQSNWRQPLVEAFREWLTAETEKTMQAAGSPHHADQPQLEVPRCAP